MAVHGRHCVGLRGGLLRYARKDSKSSLRGRRPWQSVDCFAALAKTEDCHCEECNDVAVYGLPRCARKDRVGGVKAHRRHCEERSGVFMLSSLSCFYPVDILEGVYT